MGYSLSSRISAVRPLAVELPQGTAPYDCVTFRCPLRATPSNLGELQTAGRAGGLAPIRLSRRDEPGAAQFASTRRRRWDRPARPIQTRKISRYPVRRGHGTRQTRCVEPPVVSGAARKGRARGGSSSGPDRQDQDRRRTPRRKCLGAHAASIGEIGVHLHRRPLNTLIIVQ